MINQENNLIKALRKLDDSRRERKKNSYIFFKRNNKYVYRFKYDSLSLSGELRFDSEQEMLEQIEKHRLMLVQANMCR